MIPSFHKLYVSLFLLSLATIRFFHCICVVNVVIIIIVIKGLTSLTEITSLFTDGAHHPTLLVVLQALMNLIGQVIK